jgi:hypothetical protein
MVTEVKPEQLWNAPYPMLVTLLGIVTEVKPEQPMKAPSTIDVTLSGMIKSVISLPFIYRSFALVNGLLFISEKTTLHHAAMSDMYTDIRLEQSEKAFIPIFVMLLGIVIEVRPEQLQKA